MTVLLALLFPVAIQYERGGWYRLLLPITLLALVVDVAANWTELSLVFWELPKPGEYTFSSRLERLVLSATWRGAVARRVATVLNLIAPSHRHIKTAF